MTYMFAISPSADSVQFVCEVPSLDKIKKKILVIVKTRQMKAEEFLDVNASKDIVMMELNR